jgi:hypothetical protein
MNGILQSNGKTSSMRVAMMLCVITACYISVAAVHLGRNMLEISVILIPLLGAGIAGKVIQKGQEK